jgi:TolB protein
VLLAAAQPGAVLAQDAALDTARQVTHSANYDPSLSPDGTRMVYISDMAGREQLVVRSLDGREVRQLTTDEADHEDPAWSPDGRTIAFVQVRELISGGVNTYPAWSPDGRWIAFRRMVQDTNSEVFLADSAGRGARNLTNSPAFDGWPAWSPDGRLIAFASNRGGTGDYEIYVMKPDGSEVRRVARTTGRATAPKWGRDGRTLYFPICHQGDCQIYESRI